MKALFIDRDGTLIKDKDYLHRPEEVEFIGDAIHALRKAMEVGFEIVMVTNQSGVGRGYFTLAQVHEVHDHITRTMASANVRFLAIYIAPEAPEASSRGRKPSPQFLFDARDEFAIDLSRSYMIGDKLIDLECGWNAGVRRSILVRTGYGASVEKKEPKKIINAPVVEDLSAAVDWIIKDSQGLP